MNKRIRTNSYCFLSVVGPCGSGKTQLVSSTLVILYKVFRPSSDKIPYLYNHFLPNFEELQSECVHWDAVEKCGGQSSRTPMVVDDPYQQALHGDIEISI